MARRCEPWVVLLLATLSFTALLVSDCRPAIPQHQPRPPSPPQQKEPEPKSWSRRPATEASAGQPLNWPHRRAHSRVMYADEGSGLGESGPGESGPGSGSGSMSIEALPPQPEPPRAHSRLLYADDGSPPPPPPLFWPFGLACCLGFFRAPPLLLPPLLLPPLLLPPLLPLKAFSYSSICLGLNPFK